MNIGEILIWESTNFLLLIPAVIGLVMLTRWFRGRPVFTDRDWRPLPRLRRESQRWVLQRYSFGYEHITEEWVDTMMRVVALPKYQRT